VTPERVSTAVHAVARPLMETDRWCINAASITRMVLHALGVKSYPVHAEVMHLNARYALAVAPEDYEPDQAFPPGGHPPWMTYARLTPIGADDIGAENTGSPTGLDGHVLTYAPAWRAYLDPSGNQFSRPERGIVIPPGQVWPDTPPPPAQAVYQRGDLGISIIEPTGLRGFINASGWRRKDYHVDLTREILALLNLPHSGDAAPSDGA
jgi:hypothetical protein